MYNYLTDSSTERYWSLPPNSYKYAISFFTYLSLQIEHMMEVGEDTEYEQTAMRVALNSGGGKRMEDLVSGKIRHLKVLICGSISKGIL